MNNNAEKYLTETKYLADFLTELSHYISINFRNLLINEECSFMDLINISDFKIKENSSFLRYRNMFDRLFLSCLLYTSPSPRDRTRSRMPSSA